jgi:exopolyphosphatase/guanosine-5'-triphosphate,3'-diphosphate pyrophosphatase
VIDVGTNSVKVLLADVSVRSVNPVLERSEQTRLGRGFYKTHRLQQGPIEATAQAVARFATLARENRAESIRVIATSAARDATNTDALLLAIHRASGLDTEVVSGEREALWGFEGVTTNPSLRGRRLLIVDVGGGSTEFILGCDEHIDFHQSFQIGSVRLLEQFHHSDPPTPEELKAVRSHVAEFLGREVGSRLRAFNQGANAPESVIGVGGTTSILALVREGRSDFDRQRIEATRFTRAELRALTEGLWSLSLADRRHLPGLPPERADVILTGAAIFEGVLEAVALPELGVSTRGLRFAAVMDSPNAKPPSTDDNA